MRSEVEPPESPAMMQNTNVADIYELGNDENFQKDGDHHNETIVEKPENQPALLKTIKSLDKKEEDISGDASEEVCTLPEMLPKTSTSVDDEQYTEDHKRDKMLSVEKGDMESAPPKEQQAEITQKFKAEDNNSMESTEIQVQIKHESLKGDQEGKSPQDLSNEKESNNDRISPEDTQQISEEISESKIVASADEEADVISEPQKSYHEELEPSQSICKEANNSKQNAIDNSTEGDVPTEDMLDDSSLTIKDCSEKTEIYESNPIRSEDGAYVEQLAEHATIEATEKSSEAVLTAETGPANIRENDEHQCSQTEVEENETISDLVEQNQRFPESDLQEKNVISTESTPYDHANMTNTAREGDNKQKNELTEETGCSVEEENVQPAAHELSCSDQICSTTKRPTPCSEKENSSISVDSDKTTRLNDNRNMDYTDTEAKLDMMQDTENKREVVVNETALDDIPEETVEEPYMMSEKQVDGLTLERNLVTDETGLIVDSSQNIPLPEEDQFKQLTDVTEKANEATRENSSIVEENESIRTPEEDPEKDSESNNEEIQNEIKLGQPCGNEPDIVKHLETVNREIEEPKSDQGEQDQENSVQYEAIGANGDDQVTSSKIEPTNPEYDKVKIDERMEEAVFSPEQKNIDNVELHSIRDMTSAEENLESHGTMGKLEDCTNSAVGENYATPGADIHNNDDHNENKSLSDTCLETETEAEDTVNKKDDSEKEIRDLKYTEEEQSNRYAAVESFQCAITDEIEDHKNFESTNSAPSQQHDESNTNNSNYNEESTECKEQEHNESNEFNSEDEISNEAKMQVYEEGSSNDEEGVRGIVEVSQSQDGCTMINGDTIHVSEVEQNTEKQHEVQEDMIPYDEHDGVLADQDMDVNHEFIPELREQREEKSTENEAINSRAEDLGSNSDEDISGNDNTSLEISQYEKNLDENPIAHTEVVPQDMDVANHKFIPDSSDSTEIREENYTKNEAINSIAEDIGSNTAEDLTGNENKNLEMPQKEINLVEDPIVNTEVVPQGLDVKNLESIPESTELREEKNTEIEAIHSQAEDLGSNSDGDLREEINTNLKISQKEINLVENPIVNTEVVPQDMDVEEHKLIPQSTEQREERNTENEASNSRAEDLGSNSDGDLGENNTNLEISQKEINLSEDPIVNTEVVPQDLVVENHEFIPESTDLTEENTENEAINSKAEYLGSIPTQKVGENENTNLEISQNGIKLDKEPTVQVVQQDIDLENQEPIPESTELREKNYTQNEAINNSLEDLGSDTVEDLTGNKYTNLEYSQKEINVVENPIVNTKVVPQDMDIKSREFIPEPTKLREERSTENEAIDSRAEDLGSYSDGDLGENINTYLEISQKEINLAKDPIVNTEVVPQDMDVDNHEFIPESTELSEEKNTENEASDSRAQDQGSSSDGDRGENINTNLEISQKEINLVKDPIIHTEVVPQKDVENHIAIPEPTELREEKSTENEAINSKADDLGSNSAQYLGNTNLEVSQKEINLDKHPIVNTEGVQQDMDTENHEPIPQSIELKEQNYINNEAINRVEDLDSNTVDDLTEKENTNLEFSQKQINEVNYPIVDTEVVPQDMDDENHELIPESTELREEKNTKNETIDSGAEDLSLNFAEDLGENENTNMEISQKVIYFDNDPLTKTEVVLQDMDIENLESIPESNEQREENYTKHATMNSIEENIDSNTAQGITGNENTNLGTSEKEINMGEDPIVNTEVVAQDMDVENHEFIPDSTELREEKDTENEAIDSGAEDLGSNLKILQKEIILVEDPIVNTKVVLQDMDIENPKFIPEETEQREDNYTKNEAINSTAEDLGSNSAEDLGENKNTNLEISEKETSLDKDPIVKTEVVPQDMDDENNEYVPESTELSEEKSTTDEATNGKAEDPVSNSAEDHSDDRNTDLEITQKEINLDNDPIVNTEVVPQDMDIKNDEYTPQTTEPREEKDTEDEAINSIAEDTGSNTAEDLNGNENTNLEILEKEINLVEDPIVDTEVVPQEMDVENHKPIQESSEIEEKKNSENEIFISREKDLVSSSAEDLGENESTNLEISRKEIDVDGAPLANTESEPQNMDAENHEFIPESTEPREENNTKNKSLDKRAEDPSLNTVEDLSGTKNTNLEISQKEINMVNDPIINTEAVPQDVDVEYIAESTELREENDTEKEAINSKAEDLGSNSAEDAGEIENINLEISQNEINLADDPIVNTEVVLQDMDVENHEIISKSTKLREENINKDEGVNSKAENLCSKTVEDLGDYENTSLEISQKEINLDEEPVVNTEVVPQTKKKIQDDEEPENTETISTQECCQRTLAEEHIIDQENTSDAPQLEDEVKNCVYDETIQEVTETHKPCSFNETNESVPFGNKETGSQEFQDDYTSTKLQKEQAPMHSEAYGQNEQAEVTIQDEEESTKISNNRTDVTEEINTEEVAENVEIRSEHQVIYTDATSSGNETDTSSSEEKHDEAQLLAEQVTEVAAEGQTNNDIQGTELDVHEQIIKGNEREAEVDPNKLEVDVEIVSLEESRHKDGSKEIPSEQEDLDHLASQDYEIHVQPTLTQSEIVVLTAIEPSKNIKECEPNDGKQEENVSNVTDSCINGHDSNYLTPNEIVQAEGKQTVEQEGNFLAPSSVFKATSTTQDKEDCLMPMRDLNKEKEWDISPEKATPRELQVSSGFELCGDLPCKPAVKEVNKTEEYLVPETPCDNDPTDGETMEPHSSISSSSQQIESEDDQSKHKSQQTVSVFITDDLPVRPTSGNNGQISKEVAESQEETKSLEQLIEPNNEEQTIDDITEERDHQAVKSEMTVEEGTSEENHESPRMSTYDTIEEKDMSIKTNSLNEVDNMGDDTLSSRGEELKAENVYERRGSEGNTMMHEEILGIRNLTNGIQGIDKNIEVENSVPIKDNYSTTSADEIIVAKDKRHNDTQSERTSKTTDADTLEEVPADSVEMIESSSEPLVFGESKKFEDEIMEHKDETNADNEGHKPESYELDNVADKDEKTLSNTKSDEFSINICKDLKEISEEPSITDTSKGLEEDPVEQNLQKHTSGGERPDNEVGLMESKMDAPELLHKMNVLTLDDVKVQKKKQQESPKGLESCSNLEQQQGNDEIGLTEIDLQDNVSSRDLDSLRSGAELKLDAIQSGGKFTETSYVHMDCHDAEKISAAEIIASHICLEIETEDKISEHQKQRPENCALITDANDKIVEDEVLHDDSTKNTFISFDNPTEIIPEGRQREIEHQSLGVEPNRDLQQKQDMKEKYMTVDSSMPDAKELPSEFQGVKTSAEVQSDTEESTLEMLNVNKVWHLDEKSETDAEIPGNSCKTSTDNNTTTGNFEPVNVLQSEKLTTSEEMGKETYLQTVTSDLMGASSPLNFEGYDAAPTENKHDVTRASNEDHEQGQHPLLATSCDVTEKPLIADEHSANTAFNVSEVSRTNNTPPPNSSEQKVAEQPPSKKVSNEDSDITQTMQGDKEEQLQGNQRNEEPDVTVNVNDDEKNVKGFPKEGSESKKNELPSLETMQSVTTSKEKVTAEKHTEMDEKSMPQSTTVDKKEEEHLIVQRNLQDDEKNAAVEPKPEMEKGDTENDLGEEDLELKPMISITSRDMELKAQHKKTQNILSGMGSKMKNSISKVKKAMACTSPQFSPDDVIIKLNKSKRS